MRAVLYARIACATHPMDPTIGSQLQALRNHAARRGMKIIEEFTDEGYSGLRLDRSGLDRMRDRAEHCGFDGLLTCRPDRLALARDSVLLDLIREELVRFGVSTIFLIAESDFIDKPCEGFASSPHRS